MFILNKKTLIAIIIGLVTCITSVYFLFQYAASYQQLMEIVVPKKDIFAYERLTKNNVGIKKVPVGSANGSVAIDASQVLGKVTTVPLFAGEQIRLERLSDKEVMDENKHQVAVNINLTRSVAGTIEPGDLVDIFWLSDNSASNLIARDCVVLKVTDGNGLPVGKASKQVQILPVNEEGNVTDTVSSTNNLPAVVLLAVHPGDAPQLVRGSADSSTGIVLVKKLKGGGNEHVEAIETEGTEQAGETEEGSQGGGEINQKYPND